MAAIGPASDDDLDLNLLQTIDRYTEGISGAGLEASWHGDVVLRGVAFGLTSVGELLTEVEVDGVGVGRHGEHPAAAQGVGPAVVHALVGVEAYGVALLIADYVALFIAKVVAVVKEDGVLLHLRTILL